MRGRGEREQIASIRNERRGITVDLTDIKRRISKYYENFMPINTTSAKWTNSLKDTNCQNSRRRNSLNSHVSIREICL